MHSDDRERIQHKNVCVSQDHERLASLEASSCCRTRTRGVG